MANESLIISPMNNVGCIVPQQSDPPRHLPRHLLRHQDQRVRPQWRGSIIAFSSGIHQRRLWEE